MAKDDKRPGPEHYKDKITALHVAMDDDTLNDHAALVLVVEILEDMLGIERPEPEAEASPIESVQAGG